MNRRHCTYFALREQEPILWLCKGPIINQIKQNHSLLLPAFLKGALLSQTPRTHSVGAWTRQSKMTEPRWRQRLPILLGGTVQKLSPGIKTHSTHSYLQGNIIFFQKVEFCIKTVHVLSLESDGILRYNPSENVQPENTGNPGTGSHNPPLFLCRLIGHIFTNHNASKGDVTQRHLSRVVIT